MFTFLALLAIVSQVWLSQRATNKESSSPATFSDEEIRQSICFSRQDLRLVAYTMAAILFMLGIIADKIH